MVISSCINLCRWHLREQTPLPLPPQCSAPPMPILLPIQPCPTLSHRASWQNGASHSHFSHLSGSLFPPAPPSSLTGTPPEPIQPNACIVRPGTILLASPGRSTASCVVAHARAGNRRPQRRRWTTSRLRFPTCGCICRQGGTGPLCHGEPGLIRDTHSIMYVPRTAKPGVPPPPPPPTWQVTIAPFLDGV